MKISASEIPAVFGASFVVCLLMFNAGRTYEYAQSLDAPKDPQCVWAMAKINVIEGKIP